MIRERLCYDELEVVVSAYHRTLLDGVFQLHSRIQKIWHHSDKVGSNCHALTDSFSNEWRQYLEERIIDIVVACPQLCQRANLFKLEPNVGFSASSVHYQKGLFQLVCKHR